MKIDGVAALDRPPLDLRAGLRRVAASFRILSRLAPRSQTFPEA